VSAVPSGGAADVVDVAVVGAGPAGIAAAVAAARAGRRVVVLDQGFGAGGQIWRHAPGTPPAPEARPWLARLAASGARARFHTSVVDLRREDDRFVLDAEEGVSPCRVEAARVILATGARERILPFPGWTLPGVIGVGGAQALLKMGTPFAGRRVVIAGSGPLLLPVAASLAAAGARVALVAEQADTGAVVRFGASLWRRPALLLQAARYRAGFLRTRYAAGTWVVSAEGSESVERVTVTDGRRATTLDCDVLCVGHGLVPSTELARVVGCTATGGAVVVDGRQETSVPGVYCAGEPTGIGGSDLSLVEGEIAGLCAAGRDDEAARLHGTRAALRRSAVAMERTFAPRAELRGVCTRDTIVCRCEDVALGAIDPAWSARQAKLYTRAGMGPCQGRTCGPALQFHFGWEADTVRPPIEPVLLSTLLADAASGPAPDRGSD
jgi:NADPH-dependent 2,4-dienoyl-CoA reductase/sulfur reductase-like enzyme